MPRRLLAVLALAIVVGPLAPIAARAQPAVDKTRKLIATFKSMKAAKDGEKLSPADIAANAKLHPTLDGFFDFPTFTTECLGASASKLTAPQIKEFRALLIDILRARGYRNGGSIFNEGKVTEGKPIDRDGRTAMPIKIQFPKQDLVMDVEFVYQGAKIVDLVFDGDSLTKDYRNQVSRIIAKGGAADLLKRIADKQKEAAEDASK